MLRMIQQLSGFVAGLLKMRQQGEPARAIEVIGDAYGRFAGLNASLVHAISEEDLVNLLRARGGLDTEKSWALAELLREEALAYDDLGQTAEAEPRFVKSLRLYLEVVATADDLPAMFSVAGLDAVIERVADIDLPSSTFEKLLAFLVETRQFDRAENVAVWNLEWPDPDGRRHERAVGFYEDLLRMPDEVLEAGGLPHAEVVEGLGRARLTAPSVSSS